MTETPSSQPAFIGVTQDSRGVLHMGEATPDGVAGFTHENHVPPSSVSEADLAASAALTATRARSHAQAHRHSALDDETGLYLDVRAGKVLPGFGIVTYGNFLGAAKYADALNQQIVDERVAHQTTPKLPAKKSSSAESQTGVTQTEFPELDSRVRLQVINEAAGTPATNVEKLDAFYVLGVGGDYKQLHEYLGETRGKAIKDARRKGIHGNKAREEADRAVLSRIQQWGDYIASAQIDELNLRTLKGLVEDEVNPRLPLAEVAGETHPGYGPLVRYIDTKKVRDANIDPGFDPLRTKEIRPGQNFADQHKVIVDRYTAPDLDETDDVKLVRQHIRDVIGSFEIGKLWQPIRKTPDGEYVTLLSEAIGEQAKRQKFWSAALERIVGPRKRDARQILADLGITNS